MPEFERKKRRSLTEQQLVDEYYQKKGKAAKKKNSSKTRPAYDKPLTREPLPVSPQRKRPNGNTPPLAAKTKNGTVRSKPIAPKKRQPTAARSARSDQKKKKKHGSFVLYYFMCGIVASAVVIILSVTVLFNINKFEVDGESIYTDDEIITASEITTGENLLRIDLGDAEKKIVSKLVYIDKAKISRGFPDKLVINTEPAVPMAELLISGKYYLMSEGGKLLEITDSPGEYPIVKGYALDPVKELDPEQQTVIGGAITEDDEKRIAAVNSMMALMKQYGLNKDFVIDLTDMLNIKISYDDRIDLEFGTSSDMEDKIFNMSLLLDGEITEGEKCRVILYSDRAYKRPIREGDAVNDGYVVTQPPEEEPVNTKAPEPE